MSVTYDIFDYDSKAYQATVKDNSIIVVDFYDQIEILKIPNFHKIFIGRNIFKEDVMYFKAVRSDLKLDYGSCILVQISEKQYILITFAIYYFETNEIIEELVYGITITGYTIPLIIGEKYIHNFYYGVDHKFPKNEKTSDIYFQMAPLWKEIVEYGGIKNKYLFLVSRWVETTNEKYVGHISWNMGLFYTAVFESYTNEEFKCREKRRMNNNGKWLYRNKTEKVNCKTEIELARNIIFDKQIPESISVESLQ